jgi:tetratricopeptide (TPR) repeat protein
MEQAQLSAIAEARQLVARNQRDAAVQRIRQAMQQAGRHPVLLKELGLMFAQVGQLERSAQVLEQATRLDGDDGEALWLLAGVRMAQDRPAPALLALRRALRSPRSTDDNPITGELLLQAGMLLEREGRLQAAMECYRRLSDNLDRFGRQYAQRERLRPLVVGPEKLLVRQGRLLLALGQVQQAADLLERGYRRDRTSTQAARYLMESLLLGHKYDEAQRLAMQLLAEPSQRPAAMELAERLCLVKGDVKLPRQLWEARQRSAGNDAALAAAMAHASLAMEAPDQAMQILQAARRTNPEDCLLVARLAGLLIDQHRPAEALEQLAQWADLSDQTGSALMGVLEEIGPSALDQPMLEALTQRAEQDKESAPARHLVAGELAILKGQMDLAQEQLRRAIDARPPWAPPHQAMVDLHLRRRDWTAAQEAIDRLASQIQPEDQARHTALMLQAHLAMRRGRLDEAIAHLEQARSLQSDDLPTLRLLAQVYDQADQKDKAIQTLLGALQQVQDDPQLFRQVFDLYVSVGQLRAAQQAASELLRQQPSSYEGRLMLAEVLVAQGSLPQAQQVLQELQSEYGDLPELAVLAVQTHLPPSQHMLSRAQFDQAVGQLQRLLQDRPVQERAYKLLAWLYGRCDMKLEAARQWQQLYEFDRSNRDTALAYAATLSQAGLDPQAADVLADLHQQRGDDPKVRLALAEVWEKLDRHAQAVQLLEPLLGSGDQVLRNRARLKLLGLYERLADYDRGQKLLDDWIATDAKEGLLGSLKVRKLQLWGQAGQVEAAMRYGLDWIAAAPADLVPKLTLMEVLAARKQLDGLEPLLDRWLGESSGEAMQMLRAQHIVVLGKAGMFERAMAAAQEWIRQSPELLSPRQVILDVLLQAQRKDEALALVDRWIVELSQLPAQSQPASAPRTASAPASQPATQGTSGADTLPATTSAPQTASAPASQLATQGTSRPDTLRATTSAPQTASAPASQPATQGTSGADTLPATTSAPQTASRPASQPSPGKLRQRREALQWCRTVSARLLVASGRLSEAVDRVRHYLAEDPQDPDLLDLQAAALMEMGSLEQARPPLEKAASLKPDEPLIANNLAYLYARLGVELERAEDLARRAAASQPDQVSILDTLGWVLYRRGRLGEAGWVFERALARISVPEDGNAVVHDHAGDVFYRLGWTQRALEQWRKAKQAAGRDAEDLETRNLPESTDAKIEAVSSGQEPPLAEVLDGAAVE